MIRKHTLLKRSHLSFIMGKCTNVMHANMSKNNEVCDILFTIQIYEALKKAMSFIICLRHFMAESKLEVVGC